MQNKAELICLIKKYDHSVNALADKSKQTASDFALDNFHKEKEKEM
jgi:hypothetical protein